MVSNSATGTNSLFRDLQQGIVAVTISGSLPDLSSKGLTVKINIFLSLFLFLASLLLGSPLSAADLAATIRLGFIGPLSGDGASYGRDEKNAIELAVQEINDSNYLAGTRLEVRYEDSKCSGKEASVAAQKLIAVDRVKIILGGVCSGETLGAAPSAEK